MSKPTIMRRHRYRLTGDDIASVATALATATEIDAAENSAVLQQVASHINPHARGDDGYGQLIGDDAGACLSRAAVVSQFANAPVAGLDVFVLNNGHDDRHINAILWVSVGAPANTFPVYPFASFAGCTGVSKRSAGISPVTEPVAYGSHFGTFQGGPSTQDRALSSYLLGDITDYPDTFDVPYTDDIARAVFVDTLDGPDLDDAVWQAELPAPGVDIHSDMIWNSDGLHATYLLNAK